MPSLTSSIDRILSDHIKSSDAGEREYLAFHAKRYVKSLEWVAPLLDRGEARVLELGGAGAFTKLAQSLFPLITIEHASHGLSYPWPVDAERYDVIFNMEVLEHLKDQRDAPREMVDLSGRDCCLSECYRTLKPGGAMFLTTPNICCYSAINRLIRGKNPMMYDGHFREYTREELNDILQATGFSVTRSSTVDVWPQEAGRSLRLIRMIERTKHRLTTGAGDDDRGDDIFIVATKEP